MKRQAIFSCRTCTPDGNAGVCTGYSLSCHDRHEIVELWTKRNFRCDCGNSKFGEFYCKLMADREPVNSENSYNQNYKGAYCTCHRPYPDPDVEEQVEMIQCCIREDWFHENHLGFEPSDKMLVYTAKPGLCTCLLFRDNFHLQADQLSTTRNVCSSSYKQRVK
ncbi:putative E3 ubiquitin-protein ligase UBR7 isoform X1 [Papaver somniferum]|uniref:putative E3 ubiquitin-protein ligase UBR7 isoform X1 n=1 Tax=Papaver somniferum TaxID=3469 RepID=UPI000E6FE269|nr:putative E3 ubiquitin-protein ligase UBR7 isoform X1 [Papaver somniferum]